VDDVGQASVGCRAAAPSAAADEIDSLCKCHSVKAKTEGQQRYIEAMIKHD